MYENRVIGKGYLQIIFPHLVLIINCEILLFSDIMKNNLITNEKKKGEISWNII